MLFQRTIRQTVNVHELNEQVGYHQDNLTSMQGEISDMGEQVNTAISDMGEQVNTAMSTSQSSMQSQMAASTSSQVATLTRELSSIRSSMVEQQALMTTTLAAADVAVQATVRSLNVSVQQALVAASNGSGLPECRPDLFDRPNLILYRFHSAELTSLSSFVVLASSIKTTKTATGLRICTRPSSRTGPTPAPVAGTTWPGATCAAPTKLRAPRPSWEKLRTLNCVPLPPCASPLTARVVGELTRMLAEMSRIAGLGWNCGRFKTNAGFLYKKSSALAASMATGGGTVAIRNGVCSPDFTYCTSKKNKKPYAVKVVAAGTVPHRDDASLFYL